MSSNGEDIIHETFEKLGDAIGVQMQMPDAMITNLGAVLQAQIDLLAELHSTGRLIPAGGMALTAEQVEDVRALVWLDGRRNFDAFYRLRALFPATEPAEEAAEEEVAERELTERLVEKWTSAMNAARKSEHHFPADCLAEAIEMLLGGCFPAPAEPAEEETKEEGSCEYCNRPEPSCQAWRCAGRKAALERSTTSSPVVSAPTETGPWKTVDAIPESVTQIKDCEGDEWHRCTAGWEHGGLHGPEGYAPFVAAEEG